MDTNSYRYMGKQFRAVIGGNGNEVEERGWSAGILHKFSLENLVRLASSTSCEYSSARSIREISV